MPAVEKGGSCFSGAPRPAIKLAEKTSLDLSDAFQILSVREGFCSPSVRDSKTVLVTADSKLAAAVRSEDLRVWCVLEEQPPT